MSKHDDKRQYSWLLGGLWTLLCTPLWAGELDINHLSDGRTLLALSGNGRWPETIRIEVTPGWALQASSQPWPLQVEVRPEEVRRVVGEIRLAAGVRVSFNQRSWPGLASAQHQDSYAYLRPIPSMGPLAAGEAQGRAALGEAVRVARDGIVVQAEGRDDAGFVLVAHADGTLGRYNGFRPGADVSPGRYVNRGGVLGQGVGTYTLVFRIERPAVSLDAAQPVASAVWEAAERDERVLTRLPSLAPALSPVPDTPPVVPPAPQPADAPVWRDDIKFVAQVLAATGALLFAFPLRRRTVAAKRAARGAADEAKVHLDAYAQLLRAVGGDADTAQRLVGYEIKCGASPSGAAQAALDRLLRDRARSR